MKPHIFYDYDGTLGDSLPGHIQFLHDMNQRFETGLQIPSPADYEACKALIGMPMEVFIKNAGFPEELIQRVLMMYEKTFGSNPAYEGKLFPGIPKLIRKMFDEGFFQSILSSNVKKNFMPSLEGAGISSFFSHTIDLDLLRKYHASSKANCLAEYSTRLGLSSQECIYVGDADGDFLAAQKAEIVFVGVSYGWQIEKGKKYSFPIADNPSQLERILLSLGTKS